MNLMKLLHLAPAILLWASIHSPVAGQSVSVDENTFRLYRNGEPVGTEEFSIRQIGPAGENRIILRGAVEMDLPDGAINLAPAMDAQGETLAVSDYQVRVTGSETTGIFVTTSGNRFLARIVSESGEQLREFRAGSGSVLLDEGIVHHHHLLTPYLEETSAVSLTVLSPRGGRQDRMTLSLVGEEEIRVGGVLVSGVRHFHLEGGDRSRDIWFDDQGRILRLEIPSRGFIAERESVS
jgi:hypothetical protein